MAGSSSTEILETESALVVDLESGRGGGNTLEVLFNPDAELRYSLAGNRHCISSPPGDYIVIEVHNNENEHTLNIKNGESCL